MKRLVILGAVVLCAVMLTGCSTSMPVGVLYTQVDLPVTATTSSGAKQGTAQCTSILSMVATGDCSIEAAKKNGGISEVSSIDWKAMNILGLYGEYKVRVTGK